MIRLVCIVEVADATTVDDAQHALDAFREAVLPSQEYGVTIYRATRPDAAGALYADDTTPLSREESVRYLQLSDGGASFSLSPDHAEWKALYDKARPTNRRHT